MDIARGDDLFMEMIEDVEMIYDDLFIFRVPSLRSRDYKRNFCLTKKKIMDTFQNIAHFLGLKKLVTLGENWGGGGLKSALYRTGRMCSLYKYIINHNHTVSTARPH